MRASFITFKNGKDYGNDLSKPGETPFEWLVRAREAGHKVVLISSEEIDIKQNDFEKYYKEIDDLKME